MISFLTAAVLLLTSGAGPYPPGVPPPGGYHPGLTKPLAVPAAVRSWGPDTRTPPPGGYVAGLTKPLSVGDRVRLWGPDIATPPPGGEFQARARRP